MYRMGKIRIGFVKLIIFWIFLVLDHVRGGWAVPILFVERPFRAWPWFWGFVWSAESYSGQNQCYNFNRKINLILKHHQNPGPKP